ncbi:sigma-70 family RNA polymerase sigma factor [Streptomyces turgidiscabies]|uniref:Sigma-70, region 4 n=1 Tax=Streptomyces turgidiscabies (strain Car8) TaxID=698760 RepID=L7ERZ2_STRT8|nr:MULTISPECIES: sigma-70 family RNA polymerase sigma factor [Streptomyces]ELP61491.1 sigma-70, region 4 [Streptomyces turgidiscabies Car8]MDX3497289.1 sigma-70 family RNA polymerase sigma factor [Streptomyces turgidiscabies]GAQ68614.1 RNA polymerase sigma factor [Streptomyces turgidiscabies]
MADEQAARAETLDSLCVQHRHAMVGYARRRLYARGLTRIDPEDLVHEVIARVLATPSKITHPRAYLYAVLRYELTNAARRYYDEHLDEAVAGSVETMAAISVRDFSDETVARIDLHAALRKLPPQQRRAVWLNKAVGRTQQETAQDLGKSPGTVATHVARAMSFLKTASLAIGIWTIGGITAWIYSALQRIGVSSGGDPSHAPVPPASRDWLLAMMLVSGVLISAFAAAYGVRRLWRLRPWLARQAAAIRTRRRPDTTAPSIGSGPFQKYYQWARLRRRSAVVGSGQKSSGKPVPGDAKESALDPGTATLRWSSDQGWLDAGAAQFIDINKSLAETYEDVARAGEQRNSS